MRIEYFGSGARSPSVLRFWVPYPLQDGPLALRLPGFGKLWAWFLGGFWHRFAWFYCVSSGAWFADGLVGCRASRIEYLYVYTYICVYIYVRKKYNYILPKQCLHLGFLTLVLTNWPAAPENPEGRGYLYSYLYGKIAKKTKENQWFFSIFTKILQKPQVL